MTDELIVKPPRKGGFVKGVSGNPNGRPKNSKNQITLLKLQLEGELRAQMRPRMQGIVEKMMTLAEEGDTDMIKSLVKMWVSGTKTSEEEAPKEKIVIQIGRLEDKSQPPTINGRVFEGST